MNQKALGHFFERTVEIELDGTLEGVGSVLRNWTHFRVWVYKGCTPALKPVKRRALKSAKRRGAQKTEKRSSTVPEGGPEGRPAERNRVETATPAPPVDTGARPPNNAEDEDDGLNTDEEDFSAPVQPLCARPFLLPSPCSDV